MSAWRAWGGACVFGVALLSGVGAWRSQAFAFDRVVALATPPRPPSRGVTQGVRLARFKGVPARSVWCLPGGPRALRATVALGRRKVDGRCRALRVIGHTAAGRAATLCAMTGGALWARPAGASRGVAMRVLGPHGAFRRVALAVDGRRLLVSAQVRARATQAHFWIRISGVRRIRMVVTEDVRTRTGAGGVRDRPMLSAFYGYGIGGSMPAAAVDPARHDADGLWLDGARSMSWLPLRNPPRPWSRAYGSAVRGFGLCQRDRATRDYGVHAAREQDAPDVWVRWAGRGGPVIVRERPSAGSGRPNIGAVFMPGGVHVTGHGWAGHYRLLWGRSPAHPESVAAVVSSLIGGNADTGARKYVIDYAGGPLKGRFPIGAVTGGVRVRPDTFVTQDTVGFNPYTGGYRQVVQVMPVPGRTVQVRAWLKLHGRGVSEIWRYVLFAPRVAH